MSPQTLWNTLRAEWRGLWAGNTSAPLPPGLYTYPIALEGGRRRIHLRVEPDGAGVLFVDVSEVIHLNATATEMAKLALDGAPPEQAQQQMRRRFARVDKAQLRREVATMYAMVAHFRTAEGCPVCAVAPLVNFKPVFSTPVHAPFKVDVALTYACNNACPHCYNEPGRFPMRSLARDDWFRVLDTLADIGVPHVILTGGEPTLHPDLPALIRHADARGQIVGMNTNGRRLADPALVDDLAAAGLNHVQVTLESSRAAVHNTMTGATSFDETVRGIQNALMGGLHTITNTTLTQRNRDHAVEIVEFLHDLGLHTFAMNGMIYAGGGMADPDALPAEALSGLLVAVRDRAADLGMHFLWYTVTDYCRFSPLEFDLAPKRCNAAEYSMCIEPNGDVLPCQSYYVAAGNLLTDPWDAIWNSALFRSFRDRERDPEATGLPEACRDCPDLAMCGGGCRLEHEARARGCAVERGCGGRGRGLEASVGDS
ncbi:MAG TPA: radical SAM protein [Anaerolineae bacterium]|nr:radical SAM protein [Anaerolineae bacterium]